jgi:hypothetical protein
MRLGILTFTGIGYGRRFKTKIADGLAQVEIDYRLHVRMAIWPVGTG